MATVATRYEHSSRARLAATAVMTTSACAVVIAAGSPFVAVGLSADQRAHLVADLAGALAGPFDGWLTLRTAAGAPDPERTALVNWGLPALGYLVVGRVLERLLGD